MHAVPGGPPSGSLDRDLTLLPAEVEAKLLELFFERSEPERSDAVETLLAAHPEHAPLIARYWAELRDGDVAAGGLEIAPTQPARFADAPESWRDAWKRMGIHDPTTPRYSIVGEVGRGGMGSILGIWDRSLRRPLAMKVALPGRDPNHKRFLDEAQVTGQLDHPGIVPVHELGLDDGGRPYFTMRLVRGRDLAGLFDLVRRGEGGWTLNRAVGVLLRACEAVAYAHAKGVIHRDLKPANVMVGDFGEVYVMDWGLAKVLGREDHGDPRPRADALDVVRTDRAEDEVTPGEPVLTMDGEVLGTPVYMPPEQARGELSAMGPAVDVYALGAILYHLLAGGPPYGSEGRGSSAYDVLQRVREGPPEPLHDVAPAAPAELVAVCEKAMAREPSARFADPRELADQLRAYLEGRVVHAYETGAIAELKKWVRRNKAVAALSAGVLAGVVLAASLATYIASTREAVLAAELRRRNARIERHLENGFLRLTEHDPQEAQTEFAAALAENPVQPEALAGAAWALLDVGRPDAASAVLDRWPPDVSRFAVDLLRADVLRAQGEEARAAELEAAAGRPTTHLEFFLAGRDASSNADFSSPEAVREALMPAVAHFRNALRHAGQARRLYHQHLMEAEGWVGDNATAGQLAAAMLQLWPDDAFVVHSAGWALVRSGRVEEARSVAQAAIRRDGTSAEAHVVLGLAFRETGDLDAAIGALRRAAELAPRWCEPWRQLGSTLADRGDFEASEDALRRALEHRPDVGVLHHALGNTLLRAGDPARAVPSLRRATELQPRLSVAHMDLGLALSRTGQSDAALDSLRRAYALNPWSSTTFRNLTSILGKVGELEDVILTARAARLVGDREWVYRMLGQGREATLRYGTALADLEQVTALNEEMGSEVQPLRERCERFVEVLDERLDAVEQGKRRPRNARERSALGHHALFRGRWELAAPLFAALLDQSPELLESVAVAHRFHAARAAARAATVAELAPAERAAWLRQAITWLREELAAYEAEWQAQRRDAESLRLRLSHWLEEPDLAAIRDPESLAALDDAEVESARELWQAVHACLAGLP